MKHIFTLLLALGVLTCTPQVKSMGVVDFTPSLEEGEAAAAAVSLVREDLSQEDIDQKVLIFIRFCNNPKARYDLIMEKLEELRTDIADDQIIKSVIRLGNSKVLKFFIKKGVQVINEHIEYAKELWLATAATDCEKAEQYQTIHDMIKKHIHEQNLDQCEKLLKAASDRQKWIFAYGLKKSLEKRIKETTLLKIAISKGNVNAVEFLLKFSTDRYCVQPEHIDLAREYLEAAQEQEIETLKGLYRPCVSPSKKKKPGSATECAQAILDLLSERFAAQEASPRPDKTTLKYPRVRKATLDEASTHEPRAVPAADASDTDDDKEVEIFTLDAAEEAQPEEEATPAIDPLSPWTTVIIASLSRPGTAPGSLTRRSTSTHSKELLKDYSKL